MPGTRIAQLTLLELDRPAARPYGSDGLGSHYQGQTGGNSVRNQKRHPLAS